MVAHCSGWREELTGSKWGMGALSCTVDCENLQMGVSGTGWQMAVSFLSIWGVMRERTVDVSGHEMMMTMGSGGGKCSGRRRDRLPLQVGLLQYFSFLLYLAGKDVFNVMCSLSFISLTVVLQVGSRGWVAYDKSSIVRIVNN